MANRRSYMVTEAHKITPKTYKISLISLPKRMAG
jgi:hypothetical protein